MNNPPLNKTRQKLEKIAKALLVLAYIPVDETWNSRAMNNYLPHLNTSQPMNWNQQWTRILLQMDLMQMDWEIKTSIYYYLRNILTYFHCINTTSVEPRDWNTIYDWIRIIRYSQNNFE